MSQNLRKGGILRHLGRVALVTILTGACRNPVQTEFAGPQEPTQLYPDPLPIYFSYQQDQPILPVDFGTFSEKTVVLQNAPGRQAFLVKANNSTRVLSGAETGIARSRSLDPRAVAYPGRREHEAALVFNANPPPVPQETQARSLTRSIAYGEPNPAYSVGTTKTFWVEKADKTWTELPATLRAIGQFSYIWIADENFNPSSTKDWDNQLTTAQAERLRDKFDGTEAKSYKDGIFRNVSTIFGHEYGGGDVSVNPGGRDGDQHISILVYDIDGDYDRDQTGGIYGYFWSKDFYSQEQLSGNLKTNNAEIFYLDAHFADKYPEAIYSTMAHEYQHMIHFNMKTVRRGLNSATWFNELCSMVAEDLVLENIGLNPAQYGPQSRLDIFAYHYAESGVSDWLAEDEVLKSYAGAFAFGAYLARNFGGATFFYEVLHNDKVNEAAISAAMSALSLNGSVDSGQGFSEELLRFGEALVLTANPAPPGLRSLNREHTSFVSIGTTGDGISYTALPIDLNTIQQYNLGSNRLVSNQFGLRSYLPSGTLNLRPYGLSIHTQDSWVVDSSGELRLVLEAPADTAARFYLMVR